MKAGPKFLLILISLTLMVTGVRAELELHGYIGHQSAYRINKPNDALLVRNRLRLNSELWGGKVYGFASVDMLNEPSSGQDVILNLREAYLDVYTSWVDFRCGKQQVVWGKTDGYFVNDIVNPLDLSYFLLQDFDDIRMGTTMLKTTIHSGNHSLELLLIPEFKSMQLTFSGDWGVRRPDSVQVVIDPMIPTYLVNLPLLYEEEPVYPLSLRQAEYGAKLNTFLLGADLALIYLRIREDRPVYYKKLQQDSELAYMRLIPRYPWLHFFGLNFSCPVGMFVFRGEGGYYPERWFDIVDVFRLSEGLLVRKPFVQGALGIEYQLTGDLDISVQAIHERILEYEPAIWNDEYSTFVTFLLRGCFRNDILQPAWMTLYNIGNESFLSRVWMDWNFSDNFTISLGIDVLTGSSDTFFGQYAGNDNAYLKLKYSF
jgi:hypothetical protein